MESKGEKERYTNFHSKGNHKQDENTVLRMGENIWKWSNWQEVNLQIIKRGHAAQQQQKKKNKQPNWKIGENIIWHISKEDIQGVKKHMKRCSTLLIIREMKIKTMRYHFTQVRMAAMKKCKINKCWRGCKEKGTILPR